jgi:hypothetical protein
LNSLNKPLIPKKRKSISFSKFYFFDIGVSNCLAGRMNIKPKTDYFGKAFEQFIFLELKAYLSYSKDLRDIKFWSALKSKLEVDFIIGDDLAIEVKGTDFVQNKHLKGLKAISEEIKFKHKLVVSMDSKPRLVDGITILPYREFLNNLWGG